MPSEEAKVAVELTLNVKELLRFVALSSVVTISSALLSEYVTLILYGKVDDKNKVEIKVNDNKIIKYIIKIKDKTKYVIHEQNLLNERRAIELTFAIPLGLIASFFYGHGILGHLFGLKPNTTFIKANEVRFLWIDLLMTGLIYALSSEVILEIYHKSRTTGKKV